MHIKGFEDQEVFCWLAIHLQNEGIAPVVFEDHGRRFELYLVGFSRDTPELVDLLGKTRIVVSLPDPEYNVAYTFDLDTHIHWSYVKERLHLEEAAAKSIAQFLYCLQQAFDTIKDRELNAE